jgi:hypothetical protein
MNATNHIYYTKNNELCQYLVRGKVGDDSDVTKVIFRTLLTNMAFKVLSEFRCSVLVLTFS